MIVVLAPLLIPDRLPAVVAQKHAGELAGATLAVVHRLVRVTRAAASTQIRLVVVGAVLVLVVHLEGIRQGLAAVPAEAKLSHAAQVLAATA